MRIGIDCRFASTLSGLGRYTRELVTHLLKRSDGIDYTLFVHSGDETWLPENCTLKTENSAHYSFSEQTHLPRIIKESNIDLLFSPHFNVPLRCPVPFIATIHDLILHSFPGEAPLWKQCAYRLAMKHTITKAKHIIAVSQHTADQICKTYDSESQLPLSRRERAGVRGFEDQQHLQSRISVIHEGVSRLFWSQSQEKQKQILQTYNLQSPFFLYVGSNKPHKNVDVLKRAAGHAGIRIVCVPESTGQICDDDLAALYSAATAFVTASLAEGFCLPAIEALACGCPVIAGNRGAIPDVTGGHATLIEPTVEEFVRLMRNPPPRPEPIRLYDWEETARQTVHVFLNQVEEIPLVQTSSHH